MANTTGKKFGGRKKGTPNRTTKEMREALQGILNNNIDNIDDWINEIAKKEPEKAINVLLKLTEYILPKLNKTEFIDTSIDKYDDMTDDELEEEIKKMYHELHIKYGKESL